MGYKHLTREQRYTIEALLQTPMSLREIGEVIGVSTGTVSREIRRNCDMRGYHRYRWHLAQKKDEGTTTLPEVHRRDETDRAKVHHLRPVQSGADLRSVPVEGGRDGMRRDHLPLDMAGEAPGQRRDACRDRVETEPQAP